MNAETRTHANHTPTTAATPMRSGLTLQRKCSCGGSAGLTGKCDDCEKKKLAAGALQKKLTVNEPGDAYEQEADRVAEQVMRMPAPVSAVSQNTAPTISRATTGGGGGAEAPGIVHDVLRSSGHPLDAGTRGFMEPRFGHDFSGVRIHTDARAAESARAVNALAYTVGNNVVFGDGQYAPGSGSGQRLLAHELTHVVQQGRGAQAAVPMMGRGERWKHESGAVVERTNSHAIIMGATRFAVQRVCIDGQWQPKSDGCSVPRWAVRLLGASDKDNPADGADTLFANPDGSGPCDKHDVCYQTPATGDDAKDQCDQKFKDDLMNVCHDSTSSKLKSDCYRMAHRYYQGVHLFGGRAFRQRQREIRACEGLGPAKSNVR